jgi:ferrochelatase
MRSNKNDGVLLVAHGTVDSPSKLPGFLTEIRHGRHPTEEMIREMTRRYETIGGSPLMRITQTQANALSDALQLPVLVGMRFGLAPLAAALLGAAALKLRRLVVLPVAPYSVELYTAETALAYSRLKEEGHSLGFELLRIEPWGNHPGLIRAQCEAIIAHLGKSTSPNARIILTAHSLPLRVIQAGDNYAEQVEASVRALAMALGQTTVLAYQSQGQDSAEWLGPSLKDRIAEMAQNGITDVVVVPVGFLSEHVETLYDLDHEAKKYALSLGVNISRVAALNSHASLVGVLVDLVEKSIMRADNSKGSLNCD